MSSERKVFVTGAGGQLGYDVMRELERRGYEGIAGDIRDTSPFSRYEKLDITDADAVGRVIGKVKPQAVVHCAAWTAVDLAEEAEKRALVRRINTEGTQNVASACKKNGCKMVYLSTDYVFDGRGKEPWNPDCREFRPLNVYGESKLGGEFAVANALERFFIVRIAWVFGQNGNNFIRTMLSLADKGCREVRVVDDQIGTPTYTRDLSGLLVDMIGTEKYGYYHATNEGGYISWADFAEEIFRQAGKNVKVVRVSTEEYGKSKALRPLNSRLDKSKLSENGFGRLPTWQDALARYLKAIGRT